MYLDLLQAVLPAALPEDTLRHIASFLDIDTRRALGMPPGKLTPERYVPLQFLNLRPEFFRGCGTWLYYRIKQESLNHPGFIYEYDRIFDEHGHLLVMRVWLIKRDRFQDIWISKDFVEWRMNPKGYY